MFKKIILASVFSLMIAMMTATDSSAARVVGGSATFFSGSLSCETIRVTGVGNVSLDPKSIRCLAEALDQEAGIPVLVFCSNNGGNTASGVQASLGVIFEGTTTIFPTQVDRNGNAKNLKVSSEADLAAGDGVCAAALNPNWFAVDIVALSALITVQLIDDVTDEVLDSNSQVCNLPNGETLGWDKKAKAPERRQYEC